MIFFPEILDSAENWAQFFSKPEFEVIFPNKFLNHRNVYIVYPRNFGTSDRHEELDYEEQANDVARFMYENKISTATLAGHGLGAKVALAMGCYHSERVTGNIFLIFRVHWTR